MNTPESGLNVRFAEPHDAMAIGEISVLAWRAAYAGIMPGEYLAALDPNERASRWIDGLTSPPPRSSVMVGEHGSRPVGFVAVGPCDRSEQVAELYALNLRPECWRHGFGSVLLQEAERAMHDFGFTEAVLWVLPGNELRGPSMRRAAGDTMAHSGTKLSMTSPSARPATGASCRTPSKEGLTVGDCRLARHPATGELVNRPGLVSIRPLGLCRRLPARTRGRFCV